QDYEHFNKASKFPLLNVIQGRTAKEADAWYTMAKQFSFDGWAFAGDLKEDLYEVIRRVLILLHEGRLNKDENWIHFLGLGKFKLAVLLTVLRDCIRSKTGDQDFHISMDTSSPGRSAMQYRRVYTETNFTAKSFVLKATDFPFNDPKHLGSSQPFPYPSSPIGRVLKMGDLIVKKGAHKNSRMDMLSACMLANHNYYVYSKAMLEANQLLEKHPALIVDKVPVFIQDAKRAIEDIFNSSDPFSTLKKFKKILDRV
ncbi:MAG: hypothetical protein AB3N28_12080, partial [Kordiimonas sp.]